MKNLIVILIAIAWLLTISTHAAGPDAPSSSAPSLIQLSDQYNVAQKLSWPATNVTLLTIADRKGSDQIAGWVAPVKHHFDNRVAIHGIADVSAVPWALRGLVRREFLKQQTYPVMLDWTGKVCTQFACHPDVVNVFLIARDGTILARYTGPVTEDSLKAAFATLDQALAPKPH